MACTVMRAGAFAVARPAAPKAARAGRLVVRAEQTPSDAPKVEAPVYFYAGKNYTEEEWNAALASGEVSQPAPVAASAPAQAVSFGDLMAFSGPAPELINGRLAMLAFVAALGAELSSGESVLRQWADEPTGIILAAITFSVASFIPLLNSSKREAFGPFTPGAEMLNGRAAMIGFASLLAVEALRGAALF